MSHEVEALVSALGLEPHPEGGLYRRTWADDASSAIYFLLRRDERTRWHRVRGRSEVWHFYAGAPIELQVQPVAGGPGRRTTLRLGPAVAAGERPQAVIPVDAWQRARSLGGWSLAGCTVAPPFSFDAYELASLEDPGGPGAD